jgi:hypothetical protein
LAWQSILMSFGYAIYCFRTHFRSVSRVRARLRRPRCPRRLQRCKRS